MFSLSREHHLTNWGRGKMAVILQAKFSNEFSGLKMYDFHLTFHWIGSDNGLASPRRQTVIWTNDDYLLTHIGVTQPQWVKMADKMLDEFAAFGALSPYHVGSYIDFWKWPWHHCEWYWPCDMDMSLASSWSQSTQDVALTKGDVDYKGIFSSTIAEANICKCHPKQN